MLGNSGPLGTKQFCNLLLCKSDCIIFKRNINVGLSIRGLINNDLAIVHLILLLVYKQGYPLLQLSNIGILV